MRGAGSKSAGGGSVIVPLNVPSDAGDGDDGSVSSSSSRSDDGSTPADEAPLSPAELYRIMRDQNTVIADMQDAIKALSVPTTPEVKKTSSKSGGRVGAGITTRRPHEIATPWDARTEAKFIDAANALIPSQMRELAENLKNAGIANALCVSLAHTTPSGLLGLSENDAHTYSLKVSTAKDKGQVIPAPSCTPLVDAAARMTVKVWNPDKMGDFLLAAVNYMLMLHTLVNPAFVAPMLVMIHHILTIYLGEHRGDWVHAVRFLEGVMKKDVTDPSMWAEQSATYMAAIRRLASDAAKGDKSNSGNAEAVARGGQDPAPEFPPRPPNNQRCVNWNRGVRCVDGAKCRYLHRCAVCGDDHPSSLCRGKGAQPKRPEDEYRDHRRDREDRRGDRDERRDDRRPYYRS